MKEHLQKVQDYLDSEGVPYEVLHHPAAYTALEIAGAQHVQGKEMVKSVIVRTNDGYMMCVLPAIHLIDFQKLSSVTGNDIELASEDEVAYLFPECEVGAEPPFGNWHGLPVVADEILNEDHQIVFNGGTHTDAIRMKFSDYKKLAHPRMHKIGVHI